MHFKHDNKKDYASFERLEGILGGSVAFAIFNIIVKTFPNSLHGGRPEAISIKVHPKLQTSALLFYLFILFFTFHIISNLLPLEPYN